MIYRHHCCGDLWNVMASAMAEVEWPKGMYFKPGAEMLRVETPYTNLHYEVTANTNVVRVALHFERLSYKENQRLYDLLTPHQKEISKEVNFAYEGDRAWRDMWAYVRFVIPHRGLRDQAVAERVIATMRTFIERTWPIIEPALKAEA